MTEYENSHIIITMYGELINKMSKYKEPITMTRETVKTIEINTVVADLPYRGIRKETFEHFNIRMSVCERDGKTPTDIYFPYRDQQGKITGWKRRDLTKSKTDNFHFTVIGKVASNCKLFGQHEAEKLQQRPKNLFYVEGEWDMLSCYQALVDQVQGGKYADIKPHVVSLPTGTTNAVEASLYNKEYIDRFEKIIIGFDNDEVLVQKKNEVRGKEATENVSSALLKDNIFTVQYQHPHKDPSDYLQNGDGDKLAKLLTFGHKPFIAEKIICAGDVAFEKFIKEREEGVYVKAFPKLMDKIHGFRKRELTLLTSPSGVGKTTITGEIAYELAEQGHKVGMIFLEEEEVETVQRMGARFLKVKYNNFKFNPTNFATMDELKSAHSWCSDKFFLLDHFGSIPLNDLMNKIKSFVYINKVDYIILDHLSMVVSGLDTNNERKMLDMVMTELAAFVSSNDVGILAVSHLNRGIVEDFKPPKGQEDEPFWVPVKKESMRGSAALEQLSWTILGVEPEILPNRQRGRVRLTVLKNRPWSYLGEVDIIKMDEKTGLFKNCDYD